MGSADNPYEATLAPAREAVSASKRELDFGRILKRWEKLRIVYNAVLVVWSIALLFYTSAPPGIIIALPLGGMLANLLYLLGPAIEAYMTWFGYWHATATYVLFGLGLAFTAILAAAAIL